MRSLRSAVGVCVLLGLACVTGPNNGAIHTGSIVGASFYVSGYYVNPGIPIDVQVLTAPTADTTVDANWITLATTTSGSTAEVWNGDSLYPWGATVVPVPSAGVSGRWPTGGLVKLRARGRDSSGNYVAYTFDEVTWADCAISEYAAGTSGTNIGYKCMGLGRGVVAMVSTQQNPADLGTREFLNIKGDISTAETDAYYAAWGAPATLASFKSTYNYPGTGEITATYYNDGDLGIGREMHCWQFTRLGTLTGTACYVSNYSDTFGTAKFGNNNIATTMANAAAHSGAFATVAMVTENNIFVIGPVNFVVYNAAGNRANLAQLDNRNLHKSIPNNCLTCHGVDTYYNVSTHSIGNRANFLPFDLSAFRYSTAAGLTRYAQEEAFRRLNLMVRNATSPSAAITSLIDGAYADSGGVATPGATWNDYHVPAAWTGGSNKDNVTLYNGVVKPFCRTCHMSSAGGNRDFAESADFANLKPGITTRACQTTDRWLFMPHAEHPMRKFWASGARAYLNTWTGDTTGCKP